MIYLSWTCSLALDVDVNVGDGRASVRFVCRASLPTTHQPSHKKWNMSAVEVQIETSLGAFTVELYGADAPRTVKNFQSLAEQGFYNEVCFTSCDESFRCIRRWYLARHGIRAKVFTFLARSICSCADDFPSCHSELHDPRR